VSAFRGDGNSSTISLVGIVVVLIVGVGVVVPIVDQISSTSNISKHLFPDMFGYGRNETVNSSKNTKEKPDVVIDVKVNKSGNVTKKTEKDHSNQFVILFVSSIAILIVLWWAFTPSSHWYDGTERRQRKEEKKRELEMRRKRMEQNRVIVRPDDLGIIKLENALEPNKEKKDVVVSGWKKKK
jgi:hypothetical protein